VPKPLYRAPGSDKWQEISWDQMLDRLAVRIKEARDATFVATDARGNTVNRTEGLAFAGGATFSSEEGYFAAKMMRTLGVVHIEQQARV
jgi:formate dehydrogenase major subunit